MALRSEPTWLPGYTPVHNRLFDDYLPQLSDTELRVLLVVIRSTSGWADASGRRKDRDWLSHSQLKARTGRASAAVSAAVGKLIALGLLAVEDGTGRQLPAATERRSAGSRLYFRLGRNLLESNGRVDSRMPSTTRKVLDPTFSESEIRKAKTTKENGTKDLKNPLYFSESEKPQGETRGGKTQAGEHPVASGEAVIGRTQLEPVLEAMGYGHEDPAAAGFEARYRELYRERFNQNAPETSASDGQLLLDRLEHYPTEELEHWLQMFFASDFIHFRRQNHSLRCFLESLTILRLAKPTAQGYLSTPRERSSGSS